MPVSCTCCGAVGNNDPGWKLRYTSVRTCGFLVATRDAAGVWLAAGGTDSTVISELDFYSLPLLPEGRGLTPRERTRALRARFSRWRPLLHCSAVAGTNRQLLQRVSFDIVRYNSIAMDDYGPKASAMYRCCRMRAAG